jgi:hypothetical protein
MESAVVYVVAERQLLHLAEPVQLNCFGVLSYADRAILGGVVGLRA